MERLSSIWQISREYDGIAGAGGLKDVVRGLSESLQNLGYRVRVIIPRYGFIEKGEYCYSLTVPLGNKKYAVDVSLIRFSGIEVHLLDATIFAEKQNIYTYTPQDTENPEKYGKGYDDTDEMNLLFQAAAILDILENREPPDFIHGHDGHTGMLPLFMKKFSGSSGFFNNTGVLVTIHNAGTAYQQILDDALTVSERTGLSSEDLSRCTITNRVNPLLAAGIFGYVNTVSPGYARELLSGEDKFSGSLGREYKSLGISLPGIYNGIEPKQWKDKYYSRKTPKFLYRKAFLDYLSVDEFKDIHMFGGPPNPELPWLVFHGRLTNQKGIDALLKLPLDLNGFEGRFNFIFYGQGDEDITSRLRKRSVESDGWLFFDGYSPDFTVKLIRAASFVVLPSIWEPCGQIDMIGQLLGALPIVNDVGGLKKVRNRIDGFKYSPKDTNGLINSLRLALHWEWKKQRRVWFMRWNAENNIYGRRIWRKITVRGYLPLYRKARKEIKHRKI